MTEPTYGSTADAFSPSGPYSYPRSHEAPRRSKAPAIVTGICGLLLGAGVATVAYPYIAPAPQPCATALAASEDLAAAAVKGWNATMTALKTPNSVTALQTALDEIHALEPGIQKAGETYKTAKKECLG